MSDKIDFEEGYELHLYSEEELEAVEAWIDENMGKSDLVFHEILSLDIHCDVYIINPKDGEDYYCVTTVGAGAYRMNAPEDEPKRLELFMLLPPDWKIGEEYDVKSEEDESYWPIYWIKRLSRLPLQMDTWLGEGHTIPTGEKIPGTNFTGFMVYPLWTLDESAPLSLKEKIADDDTERRVMFYTLIPLYDEEMNYKLEHGTNALLERFREAEMPFPPVVDVNRPNVCEGFQLTSHHEALNDVYWAFNDTSYDSVMTFWAAVSQYNEGLEHPLDDFNPFETLFASTKVKDSYEAYIDILDELQDFETLDDPDSFVENTSDEGPVEVIATLEASQDGNFVAMELLWYLHQLFLTKDLGDHKFFEGLSFEGYDDEGTPMAYVCLGS